MRVSREVYCRLALLSVAALLLHAAVLGGASWFWPSNLPPPVPAAALQVRVIEPVAPVEARPIAPIAPIAPKAAPLPLPALVRVVRANPARKPALAPALAPPVVVATATDDDEPIPLYRTRFAPATTLRYEVSRGALHGTGELAWSPRGERYELKLDFNLDGLTILSQTSTGGFDEAGLAPLRFTDQRVRRGTMAANFQRAAGKISYSGSPSEFALKAGAQDRISWMLQLAAIVSADPQLAAPGAKVVMLVTGARGDAGVWVLRSIGPASVDTRGGAIDALEFVREPREPFDTRVRVWLDPKHDHLPVRATQNAGGSDEGIELRLRELIVPN